MSTPKRVLLLDTGNEWGGGTNSMFELLKRIDRSRFDVTCCFYKDYRKGKGGRLLSEELADIDIPLILMSQRKQSLVGKLVKESGRSLLALWPALRQKWIFAVDRSWRIRPCANRLADLLRDGRFDLIYMNNQPSSNLEGYWAAERAGVPAIQHCRIETQLRKLEVDTVNRLAKRVICVSWGVAESLRQQGVKSDMLAVVPNGIDAQQILPRPIDLCTNRLVIGTVGQLVARKSISHLLEALAILLRKRIDVEALIVGEGAEEQVLRAQAARLDIQQRVRFVGFQVTPLAWIAAMDIFVLPSAREGLPRVVLEAMLLGKPVVAAKVPGVMDVVEDGRTGLLYDHGNIEDLASHIVRLANDPVLRADMGHAGRHRVATDFSIEHYVQGVQDVLSEALCSGSC